MRPQAALEDSSEVPQVWRLRSEGSWTSHNGSSVNFLGDGTIFWGDGTDGLSFVERSTELRDWPIVGGMREMVKLDGESVGFRIGQQVDWSLTPESDAQWRVYSTVVKDPKTGRNTAAEQEGVKVRTTPRTLLSLLWAASLTPPEDACFLGQVEYMSQERAAQRVANEVARERLNAFGGGLGHAETLLVKRDPFKHETEVRLVYVEHRDGCGSDHIFAVPFDPNSTFEEVMLDPRLHPDDVKEREAEFSSLGFKHPVKKSNLYQRVLYEIVLDERGWSNALTLPVAA